MTNRPPGSVTKDSSPIPRKILVLIVIAFTTSILISGLAWLVPIEIIQQWALDRAGQDPYARFEAVGKAEFSVWLIRIASSILPFLIWYIWSNVNGAISFANAAWNGLATATTCSTHQDSSLGKSSPKTIACRTILVAWMILFVAHFAHGIGDRIHDWPYFRFNSGNVVLPNISDSNRAVIRYLQEATPPNARILIASDQKLFFLSYYLRPRTLLHRMHPDSEHVIPLKDQQRKLNAFRLEDLSPDDLKQMPHDYTLEYFEHPDLVDPSKILDDKAWINFIRRREKNPTLIPSYEVRLRATKETSR